jgi:hypothetical protein
MLAQKATEFKEKDSFFLIKLLPNDEQEVRSQKILASCF